jgi:serine/threonine-protein kinase
VVTRLIESAQTRPIDADLPEPAPEPRREITRTVKVVMRQARSLPVAVALVLIAAAFIVGVVLGDRRETSPLAPVVVPSPTLAGAIGAEQPAVAAAPLAAGVVTADTGFDLRVEPSGARVVLDGRAIGVAPLRVRNLTPGEHVIELEADGYFARRLTVSLEADAPETLSIGLDRLRPEPEPERPAARSAPAPDPTPATPQPAEKGTLKIGSKPPCDVLIDGRRFGKTPQLIKLSAGRHKVHLVNRTYSIRERIGVEIEAGETVKVIRDYSDALESSNTASP